MSKYKAGDKFIIEIGQVGHVHLGVDRYYIKGFNTLVFDDNGLNKLEPADTKSIAETFADYIDEVKKLAYNEGFKKGKTAGWMEGYGKLAEINSKFCEELAKVQEVAKGERDD